MKPRILLVEDNDDDVELTRRAFRKINLDNELVVARDGQEALDYVYCTGTHASREPTMPEVILLDLKLPKIDGLDVLRRLRQDPRSKLVPVVVLTSSTQDRDIVESYELGANSYVQKPVDFGEFLEATRQLGMYWLVLNRRVDPHGR